MNNDNLRQTMRDAMQLMGTGDLNAATAAIQSGLRSLPARDRSSAEPAFARSDYVDADYSVVADVSEPGDADVGRADTPPPSAQVLHTGTFTSPVGARDYLAYAPAARPLRPSPLLLMLHGCTQDAADFARGTRMHLRAAAEGYVVVYPTQAARSNGNGCWNWFRSTDQQRGAGEPALLAGLVAQMVHRFACDPARIYAAGLSAGGAMAVTLGRAYPDIFRGLGVHSGLPHACARDVQTALAAMRSGAAASPATSADAPHTLVPTIVFHGDYDPTVNVRNAARVVAGAMRPPLPPAAASEGERWLETVAEGRVAGGYEFTTTRARDGAGRLRVETWIVHGAGHAWFGGSPEGTFTDAKGPDATTEMLRFFRSLD